MKTPWTPSHPTRMTALSAAIAASMGLASVSANATHAEAALSDVASGAHEIPVVITATRLKQSLQDVPASMTIITMEQIKRQGITSVAEAMRLVPGMAVTRTLGSTYRINYHGTSMTSPRRLNVLVDGVSVYQPSLSRIDWQFLPVSFEDINRIEVTRGANSAAYGPNSMMAVVNIITNHPADTSSALLAIESGGNGERSATVRVGIPIATQTGREGSARLTVSRHADDGFDRQSRPAGDNDSFAVNRITARGARAFGSTDVDLSATMVSASNQLPFVDGFQRTNPNQRQKRYLVAASVKHQVAQDHEVSLKVNSYYSDVVQRWTSCVPGGLLIPEMNALWKANPAYATALTRGQRPSGGTPADDALALAASRAIAALGPSAQACSLVNPNQDYTEQRSDIEATNELVLNEQFRFLAGVGFRKTTSRSQTFFGGKTQSDLTRVFGSGEFRPTDRISLNAGAFFEKDSAVDSSFSPRLAANVRLSPTLTGRAVWSRATRSPDVFEQSVNWGYRFTQTSPPVAGRSDTIFYQSAVSPGGLGFERNRSMEIGLLAADRVSGLLADVKIFDEHLTSLISEKIELRSFRPTNRGWVKLRGAELQVSASLVPGLTGSLSYSYLDSTGPANSQDRSQYSRHSGNVSLTYAAPAGWSLSTTYYGSSGDAENQSGFARLDVTAARQFDLSGNRARLAVTARTVDQTTVRYYQDVGSFLESYLPRATLLMAQLSIAF